MMVCSFFFYLHVFILFCVMFILFFFFFFFFQAEDGIRDATVTGVQTCALPIFRIDDSRALDPYAVARILRVLIEKEAPHVVIMGKQAVDDDSNQVGQMLAGLLRWPQATFVSKIEFLGNKTRARCTRGTDAGLEVS